MGGGHSGLAPEAPGGGRGFTFFVLQDGSKWVQVVLSPDLRKVHCQILRDVSALIVYGLVHGQPIRVGVFRRLRSLTLEERELSKGQRGTAAKIRSTLMLPSDRLTLY